MRSLPAALFQLTLLVSLGLPLLGHAEKPVGKPRTVGRDIHKSMSLRFTKRPAKFADSGALAKAYVDVGSALGTQEGARAFVRNYEVGGVKVRIVDLDHQLSVTDEVAGQTTERQFDPSRTFVKNAKRTTTSTNGNSFSRTFVFDRATSEEKKYGIGDTLKETRTVIRTLPSGGKITIQNDPGETTDTLGNSIYWISSASGHTVKIEDSPKGVSVFLPKQRDAEMRTAVHEAIAIAEKTRPGSSAQQALAAVREVGVLTMFTSK